MKTKTLAIAAVVALCAAPILAATYYVDPTGGTVSSDNYDGTAETWQGGESTVGPKRTLAAALEGRANGDVVIALPGVYDDGVSNEGDRDTGATLNRVKVPSGVTLMSRDGAEKTIIMGAKSPNPVWEGCGTNAVRCANVLGASASPRAPAGRLVGFTLTGGRTGVEGNNSAYGGGGAEGSGICIDCIVSNNACHYRGGGGNNLTFVRSRFLGGNNSRNSVGFSLNSGKAIHCLVKGGSSFQTTVIGSTFIAAIPRNSTVYNSLLMSTSDPGNNPITAYRSIVVGNPISNFTFEDGSHYTNSAAVALGPDGMPGPGSVAIDFGNDSYLASQVSEADWRKFDLSGESKRIANGSLDIGCFERDWYEEYSVMLSPLGAAEVTNATSYVELSGVELVVPTNGAANILLKPFENAESLYSFFAEVTGPGTLSVYLDGSETPAYTFTENDGKVETKLTITGERDARFVYAGESGSARLSNFSFVSYACLLASQRGIAVDGDIAFGTNYVASGQTATFTVNRAYDSDVVCTGVEVNGEFFPFDGHPEGYSFTVSGDDRSSSVLVKAVYKDGLRDWYVDAENGDDANTGLYTNNAFRTLKVAVENPRYVTGEVIWAMPGDYKDAVCTNMRGSVEILSRVAVSNMVLRSMEGPEKTIIRGAASTDESAADNGCGPGAIRCVFFTDTGIVEGFTITDGRSLSNTSKTSDLCAGGGVHGGPHGGYVVDCILSNNHARSGGALYGGTVIRGRVLKNGGLYGLDAYSGTVFIDSYLANDKSGYYNTYSSCACYNCTFGPTGVGPRNSKVYNCVLRNNQFASSCSTKFYNCLMVTEPPDKGSDSTMTDCIVTNVEAMAIGDYYRPGKGSPAIDAGSMANYALITNTLKAAKTKGLDLFGGQRIYNGKIDIGCGEHDWRGEFAKTLADKGVSVQEASEDVTLGDPAGLDVAAGHSLRLGLVLKTSGKVSFAVDASDPGEVSVLVDGVAVAIGEDGRVSFDAEEGECMVEIVCSGEGLATVSDVLLPGPGFMMILK